LLDMLQYYSDIYNELRCPDRYSVGVGFSFLYIKAKFTSVKQKY
jgi:hypothetical protein